MNQVKPIIPALHAVDRHANLGERIRVFDFRSPRHMVSAGPRVQSPRQGGADEPPSRRYSRSRPGRLRERGMLHLRSRGLQEAGKFQSEAGLDGDLKVNIIGKLGV